MNIIYFIHLSHIFIYLILIFNVENLYFINQFFKFYH